MLRGRWAQRPSYSDVKLRIRRNGGSEWEMSFATPADFLSQDGSPCRGLHVRRESEGGVPRSRPFAAAPCQTLFVRFATFTSVDTRGSHSSQGLRPRRSRVGPREFVYPSSDER
jgi:hypothetical protein